MWQLPDTKLALEPGEMHLWRANCVPATIKLGEFESLLTVDEIGRARRFATETLRRRYLQAHGLLHTLLRAYTQAGPDRCELGYHAKGKPFLRAPQLQPTLEFNLSHAGDVVMIAFVRGFSVGVDVEIVRPLVELDGMISAYFGAGEQAYLAAFRDDDRLLEFFRLWTRKEAWLKLCGAGIGRNLKAVEV